MNHDYAHCSDFEENCPRTCFRAQLVRDLKNNTSAVHNWISWMPFLGTSECEKVKND